MLFWLILTAFVLNGLGAKYGISYLFLWPEYRGSNDLISFALLGFSIGGFIISYNLYTYIIHGHRFPFIATLDRPFFKFSINNFIIPAVFLITYYIASYTFQVGYELISSGSAIVNLIGFTLGMCVMLVFTFVYFYFTNKNIKYYAKDEGAKPLKDVDKEEAFASSALQKKSSWEELEKRTEDWHVETYLGRFLRVRLARSSSHYPREVLEKVLSQHHINASLFELLVIISFIIVGLFREKPVFEIPAAASAVLFFTILIMIFSAVYSWIKGWTFPVIALLILLINSSPKMTEFFNLETRVYGLDYAKEQPVYNLEELRNTVTAEEYAESMKSGIATLENWKKNQAEEKPKLIVFSVSGGGLRSALWTMRSLLYADSMASGKLLNQVQFISGSSGGMMGASYLREIVATESDNGRYKSEYLNNVSKDLLNPVILAMATHDLAFRYRKANYEGNTFLMDRAFAFETKLHKNTNNVFERTLESYRAPERAGEIPTMVFAPTINLDGRRLLISSSNVDYLCYNYHNESIMENVSYAQLFSETNYLNTRFSSVLRMNATFPYILPGTTLPTNPPVKVSDAGLRDNFGMRITLDYLMKFKDWIKDNTSGVILVQVRDTKKDSDRTPGARKLLSELTAPLGGVYSNVIKTQDYDNELQYDLTVENLDFPIYRIPFELEQQNGESVSLNWHLTELEKSKVISGVFRERYQTELTRLLTILD